MIQECGICGKKIETGGMGGAPMCEHYKWNHPRAFFGSAEEIPAKYRRGGGPSVHPNPGEQSMLTDYPREGSA